MSRLDGGGVGARVVSLPLNCVVRVVGGPYATRFRVARVGLRMGRVGFAWVVDPSPSDPELPSMAEDSRSRLEVRAGPAPSDYAAGGPNHRDSASRKPAFVPAPTQAR